MSEELETVRRFTIDEMAVELGTTLSAVFGPNDPRAERFRKLFLGNLAVSREERTYLDNPGNTGYFIPRDTYRAEVDVPHTVENDSLFEYNAETKRFEVRYDGSQRIIDFLELQRLQPWSRYSKLPRESHIAFFDKQGNFHNFALLETLRPGSKDRSSANQYHTAFFRVAHGNHYERLIMPIDNIYCLSMVPHPLTFSTEGGEYN